MIKTEYYMTREDGVRLVRTYSDAGRYVVKTTDNSQYTEAIDPEGSGRTYVEGKEIPVEEPAPEEKN